MATEFNTQVSNGEYRLQFETDNREYYLLMQSTARRCADGGPVTNADIIRSMSDEELANIIDSEGYQCPPHGDCEKMNEDCKACWLSRLQRPAGKKLLKYIKSC